MFVVSKRLVADVEPTQYLPGADGLTLGSAAVMASGALAKCGATAKPDYIIEGPKNADGNYPVIAVLPTTQFETKVSATVATTVIGSAVTLDTDALGVTATTASGVFTVEMTDAAAGGGVVRGRFK